VKVKIKNIRPHFQPNQVGIVKEFVKFLQNNGPLKSDVNILFQDKRNENITTGKQQDNTITIFAKDRLLVDVLRTLAHEWIHILQTQNMKTMPNLDRPSEDHANSLSGYWLRQFNKENPEHETEVYKD
jgi:hypothetical protein